MTTFKKDLNIAHTTPNNIVCTDHGSRNSRMSKLRTPVGADLTLSTDPWREAARNNNTLAMTEAARYLRSLGTGPLNLGVEQSFVELQVQ